MTGKFRAEKRLMSIERIVRWALVAIAVTGLAAGAAARTVGQARARRSAADVRRPSPSSLGLAAQLFRDFMAGRLGVDAIALISMSARDRARPAAGRSGGGADVFRRQRARGDRGRQGRGEAARRWSISTPRIAHRRVGDRIDDAPVDAIAVGDRLLVQGRRSRSGRRGRHLPSWRRSTRRR